VEIELLVILGEPVAGPNRRDRYDNENAKGVEAARPAQQKLALGTVLEIGGTKGAGVVSCLASRC